MCHFSVWVYKHDQKLLIKKNHHISSYFYIPIYITVNIVDIYFYCIRLQSVATGSDQLHAVLNNYKITKPQLQQQQTINNWLPAVRSFAVRSGPVVVFLWLLQPDLQTLPTTILFMLSNLIEARNIIKMVSQYIKNTSYLGPNDTRHIVCACFLIAPNQILSIHVKHYQQLL